MYSKHVVNQRGRRNEDIAIEGCVCLTTQHHRYYYSFLRCYQCSSIFIDMGKIPKRTFFNANGIKRVLFTDILHFSASILLIPPRCLSYPNWKLVLTPIMSRGETRDGFMWMREWFQSWHSDLMNWQERKGRLNEDLVDRMVEVQHIILSVLLQWRLTGSLDG